VDGYGADERGAEVESEKRPSQMSGPLKGPRAKLSRAAEHLKSLEDATTAFMSGNPHSYFVAPGRMRGEHIVRYRSEQEVPTHLALIAGDCLQNLRSSLDHLVYAFWHSDEAQFPIMPSASAFRSRGLSQIAGTSVEFKAVVTALQPYQPGQGGKNNLLWWLRELSNADKHRALHIGQESLLGSRIKSMYGRACRVVYRSPLFLGRLKDGMELCRLRIVPTGPGPDVNVQLELVTAVCFNEFGPGRGQIVLDVLSKIHGYVESILPSFESLDR
jgi:hypothetical protein